MGIGEDARSSCDQALQEALANEKDEETRKAIIAAQEVLQNNPEMAVIGGSSETAPIEDQIGAVCGEIEINRLTKDELFHELRVRKFSVTDKHTVEQMRVALRKTFANIKTRGLVERTNSEQDIDNELGVVIQKLETCENLITDSGASLEAGGSGLSTKLAHIKNRLNRLDPERDEDRQRKTDLQKRIRELEKLRAAQLSHKEIRLTSGRSGSKDENDTSPINSRNIEEELKSAIQTIRELKMKITQLEEPEESSRPSKIQSNEEPFKVHVPHVTPPNFYGKPHEKVEEFVMIYEQAGSVNNWSSTLKLKFLPLYLKSSAQHWFESFTETQPNATWEETKQAFVLAFRDVSWRDRLEHEFHNRRQMPGETAESYVFDLLNICRKIYPEMKEEDKVRRLTRGLLPAMIEKIRAYENLSVDQFKKNLQSIKATQFMVEQATSSQQAGEISHHKIEAQVALLTEEIRQLRGSREKVNNQTTPGKCYTCGRQGHFARECRERRRTNRNERGLVRCFYCGRQGHFAVACRAFPKSEQRAILGNGEQQPDDVAQLLD